MKWEHIFIDKLLTKYESSKQFQKTDSVSRKINIPFSIDKFKEYHYGTPREKMEIKEAVLKLVEQKLVHVRWRKNEIGNLIEEIVLNIDHLNEAYRFIERRPKFDELEEFKQLITEHTQELSTLGIGEGGKQWLEYVTINKKIPSIFPSNSETRNKVILALSGLASLDDDIDERMFSINIFRNSKVFLGSVKAGVARILRAQSNMDSETTDAEILEEYGILETGSEFHIAGNIIFMLPEGQLDISAVSHGISLHSPTVKIAEIAKTNASIMLSVENMAIFRECTRKRLQSNLILIYSGGFYSRRKLELIKRIRTSIQQNSPQARFYHWGDIDLGGFRIYRHLKNKAIPELQPFMMSPELIDKYYKYCTPIQEDYLLKIQQLVEDELLTELRATITTIVEKKVRLEQEAILCQRSEAFTLPL